MNAADQIMLIKAYIALEREAEYWRGRSIDSYTEVEKNTYLERSKNRQQLADEVCCYVYRERAKA